MKRQLNPEQKTNAGILDDRLRAMNARLGPRVGDYIKLVTTDARQPAFTRITHDWGEHLQTGGMGGSYYLMPSGHCSYSGGLDPGIKAADLVPTNEAKEGRIWFFDQDIHGAGRGVEFPVVFRVFTIRPGADQSGIGELQCPYHFCALTPEMHARTRGYWFTITKDCMAHVAFKTEQEALDWLKKEHLALATTLNGFGHYPLKFAA